jgi:methylated-DNA-[protein]-cysteine S-methyltransferase
MTQLLIDRIDFALGKILLVTDGEKLCSVDFSGYEKRLMTLLQKRYTTIELIETVNPQGFSDRLQAYLKGEYDAIADIPVSTGGTDFQQTVWQMLRSIPSGQVMTYGELATRIGKPTASRAVGMANSLNPVSIVLPCHRVIGANASLTGYAGGLDTKRWLLHHEGFLGKPVQLQGQLFP